MKHILVTGGAGFIGSNFVQMLAGRTDYRITVVDVLAYAGTLEPLRDLLAEKRIAFQQGDITERHQISDLISACDVVVNFAAHSHVDRSIRDASPFMRTNALGVMNILDTLSALRSDRLFLQVSTDEVYGDAPPHRWFTEEDRLRPSNPYSASKAAADSMIEAYVRTHGVRACITRCTNNYGAWQYPEKLVAMCITSMLNGKKIPIHGDGLMLRDWIHVGDHCDAIFRVMERGESGQIYNVAGLCELSTRRIVEVIADCFGRTYGDVVEPISDRPGNDRRYAISPGKTMSALGWRPGPGFAEHVHGLIDWYRQHEAWWRHIMATPHYQLHHETLRRGLQ
jgi:dTDP-glucose 4,6-dehydratase